jgi:hypothetical protein
MTNEDYDTVSFARVLCRTNAPQGGQKMRGEFQGQHAKLKSNNFPAIVSQRHCDPVSNAGQYVSYGVKNSEGFRRKGDNIIN